MDYEQVDRLNAKALKIFTVLKQELNELNLGKCLVTPGDLDENPSLQITDKVHVSACEDGTLMVSKNNGDDFYIFGSKDVKEVVAKVREWA